MLARWSSYRWMPSTMLDPMTLPASNRPQPILLFSAQSWGRILQQVGPCLPLVFDQRAFQHTEILVVFWELLSPRARGDPVDHLLAVRIQRVLRLPVARFPDQD